MVFRPAVPSDLEQLVELVPKAMVKDPAWPYRFIHRAKFVEDHRRYTEVIWRSFLSDDYKDWSVFVIEKMIDGKPTILAFSVWNFSYANKTKYGTGDATKSRKTIFIIITYDDMMKNGGATRQDADPDRIKAFERSGERCNEHFNKDYGDRRITLQILGTHPDHTSHGYATTLCRRGMEIAHKQGLVCTVQATSLGHRLYQHLGFTDLTECHIQVPGKQEIIECWAMVWDPKRENTSSAHSC
ncbi:hypothetical protein BKA56DRAFT_712194 [Ilyonectria sp. MPI-CAGE-AT-0026]|nr:hypothetical protein BKA56DRAFT_712194 [Ilyonectria sp. MPI-CAGE-AT-0026]